MPHAARGTKLSCSVRARIEALAVFLILPQITGLLPGCPKKLQGDASIRVPIWRFFSEQVGARDYKLSTIRRPIQNKRFWRPNYDRCKNCLARGSRALSL